MNKDNTRKARYALKRATLSMQQGSKAQAHLWSSAAARICPELEEPWLILAATGTPRASIVYLKHALGINPNSEQAQTALWWALQRNDPTLAGPFDNEVVPSQEDTVRLKNDPTQRLPTKFRLLGVKAIPWMIATFVLCITLMFTSLITPGINVRASNLNTPYQIRLVIKPANSGESPESLPDAQNTVPILTPSATKKPAQTTTPTVSVTTTVTATNYPTNTLIPSATPPPPIPPFIPPFTPPPPEPQSVVNNSWGERWIDVDLSNQKVYAYEGDQIVREFVVSTGTYQYPTVTGQYHIYLKFQFDDMSGPGYYLPDVPYTMYFYKGYSFHGTYWHDNFGTPMSHGCVNMRTDEAGWLFEWASIGTMVNVHY